jgi:hypothetical protein
MRPEVSRISPLTASTRYLEHLRWAWEQAHPEAPFAEQDITVTIPASFDPAARELTAEACKAAGFAVTLLEEPRPLYSWIQASGGQWRKQVKHGDIILVVDVGGGTTDLSLIAVLERDGNLELHIAVGEHILLGGDNMDLALAYGVARKLAPRASSSMPGRPALAHGCRACQGVAGRRGLQAVPVVVPSRGSKLIGGSIRTEVTRRSAGHAGRRLLPQGGRQRQAQDPRARRSRSWACPMRRMRPSRAIWRPSEPPGQCLAEIEGLDGDQWTAPPSCTPAILFNGGVLKAPRSSSALSGHQRLAGRRGLRARAPAGRCQPRSGRGARRGLLRPYRRQRPRRAHRGGTAQSYYVGVESNMPAIPGMEPPLALCLAPFGMEEGTEVALPDEEFGLVVGEPVRLRFFGSSVRRTDRWHHAGLLGTEELVELQEIELNLPAAGRVAGEVVPVTLQARVTDIGTLELNAVPVGGSERWKVEFDVRAEPLPRLPPETLILVAKPAGRLVWRAFFGRLAAQSMPCLPAGPGALHATACEMALCMILINLYQ